MSGVDISAIEIDKDSDGYRQLRAVTQDISAATVQAQTEINIQNMRDTQRINAEHMAETLRAQRETEEYARRIQIQTEHLATHQLNQQAAVGMAGAEALGRMAASGGTGLGGMNPAAIMAGMAMGGAIGQNMAGMMNGMLSGMNQPTANPAPPPIPSTAEYHIAVNGQSTGPYNMSALRQMAQDATLTPDSLVWKSGMQNWVRAGDASELQALFHMPTPPPVPPAL